jgi:hypothetical protein
VAFSLCIAALVGTNQAALLLFKASRCWLIHDLFGDENSQLRLVDFLRLLLIQQIQSVFTHTNGYDNSNSCRLSESVSLHFSWYWRMVDCWIDCHQKHPLKYYPHTRRHMSNDPTLVAGKTSVPSTFQSVDRCASEINGQAKKKWLGRMVFWWQIRKELFKNQVAFDDNYDTSRHQKSACEESVTKHTMEPWPTRAEGGMKLEGDQACPECAW